MATHEVYRWRKTNDINREHGLFGLLDGETLLLGVGFTEEGGFQAVFNPAISRRAIEVSQLMKLLEKDRALTELDR